MDGDEIQVYFTTYWTSPDKFLSDLRNQSPGKEGKWKEIKAVTDPNSADYHVGFDRITLDTDPEKLLLFDAEPPCITGGGRVNPDGVLRRFPLSNHHKPQRWFLSKNYDELASMEPLQKTRDLSWITTDKGRDLPPIIGPLRRWLLKRNIYKHQAKDQNLLPGLSPLTERRAVLNLPTDGHILRMDFLDRLCKKYPDLLDLYGRGSFPERSYLGEIDNKWDGLAPYRYSLAIENYRGPNFFTEKLTDALLAWCMPICWGCTNLDRYLPQDSFIEIDIEDPSAPERIREIVQSEIRERNIDAIAEARQRILNEYQIWPTVRNRIVELQRGLMK